MSLGAILLLVLVIATLAVLPNATYSRDWGYGPGGGVGALALVVLVLILNGKL